VRAEKIWLLPEATGMLLGDDNEVRRFVEFYDGAWHGRRAMVIRLSPTNGATCVALRPMLPTKHHSGLAPWLSFVAADSRSKRAASD
jgi:hypothetical protein